MARSKSSYLNELSTADLKQLLEARQRIDVLEKERARLQSELTAVEDELKRLVAGVEKPARSGAGKKAAKKTVRRKVTKKKVTKKKVTKKKVTKKKVTKKKVAKKKAASKKVATGKAPAKKVVTRKKATGKKTAMKAAGKKATSTRRAGGNQPKLEDIVVEIIRKAGKPVSYTDIMAAITAGKLFTSKSKNFDNVLRRTLSTSKKVKRAGRGIYDLA
jgi:hypothetical protein